MPSPSVTRRLPTGRYFFGDPCYCFQDDSWQKIVDDCYAGFTAILLDPEKYPKFDLSSTRYGDGEYLDNRGNRYLVDSGTIGLVHESMLEVPEQDLVNLGTFEVFDNPFLIEFSDGIFKINGSTVLDTTQEYD